MNVLVFEELLIYKKTLFKTLLCLILVVFFLFTFMSYVFAKPLKYEGHGGPVMGLATSVEKNLLASTSFDYSVLLWEFDKIKEVQQLIGHDAAVNVAKFSGSGKLLATGGDDAQIFIWNTEELNNIKNSPTILSSHTAKIVDIDFSNDERKLASAGWDHSIKIWDTVTGKLINSIVGHNGPVNAVNFSNDGKHLYSAGYDGTIRLWNIIEGFEIRTLIDNGWGVNVLEIDEKKGLILYGTIDGLMKVQKIDKGEDKELFKLWEEGSPVSALNFYPKYNMAVFGNMRGRVVLLNLETMEVEKDFLAVDGPVWDVVYNHRNETVIVGGLDDTLTEWKLNSFHSNYFLPKINDRRFHQKDALSNGALQFARKCSICHTLDSKDIGRRAGPPLHGVFGRTAGSLKGYSYSKALIDSDIIWNEDTISRLFKEGPEIVTPGTKMPIQKIKKDSDRLDLIYFLKDATQ